MSSYLVQKLVQVINEIKRETSMTMPLVVSYSRLWCDESQKLKRHAAGAHVTFISRKGADTGVAPIAAVASHTESTTAHIADAVANMSAATAHMRPFEPIALQVQTKQRSRF